jgi:hypothetical protein
MPRAEIKHPNKQSGLGGGTKVEIDAVAGRS